MNGRHHMKWIGPYTIDDLLDLCLTKPDRRPAEANGVYLISERKWEGQPTRDCIPLYVGGNTSTSTRLRIRVGDLIADMFGFFRTRKDHTATKMGHRAKRGHHSGGQTLYEHCRGNALNPKKLYVAWVEECGCARCAENQLYGELTPLLNKNRPPQCNEHHRLEQ
jgi:hypothetical protein